MSALEPPTLPRSHADTDAPFDLADPHAPLAPFYCRAALPVATTLLALVVVVVASTRVMYSDLYGHLRFGDYILQHHELPEHEPFLGEFSDQERPVVHFYWLGQVVLFRVFDLGKGLAPPDADHQLGGGLVLLGLLHALVVALRLVLLLLAFRRRTGSLPFAVVGIVWVIGLSYYCHLRNLRPQIFGELGFAAVLFALSTPVLSRRALAWVPAVVVLWVNCHGSFPLAFVLFGLALGCQALRIGGRAVRERSGLRCVLAAVAADLQVRRLALVLLLSFVAVGVANPHHFAAFGVALEMSHHPNLAAVTEWAPLLQSGQPLAVPAAALLPALVLLALNRRRVTLFDVVLVVALGWQMLSHARLLVWWIMVVPWVVVPHLHDLWRRWLPAWMAGSDRPDFRKSLFAVLGPCVLLLGTPAAAWFLFDKPALGSRRALELTPVAAGAYLRDQYASDPALRRVVFTSETAGDYLLWDLRLDPPVRFTCYSHIHLLTPEHLDDCIAVKLADPGWEKLLDAWGVQFLVVERTPWHARLMEEVRAAPDRWEVVPGMGGVFVAKYRGKRG